MSTFTITIDGHPISVSPGQTVLQAARMLGLDIPALCYLEKCGPLNSCQVCLVKINGKLAPSCGATVQSGMVIESETDEIHEARRTALELLFSEHVGDCLSPCQRLCPLRLNIPLMLRQVHLGEIEKAIDTVRDALPLAGVLGHLCHHPCEQGCRRGLWDTSANIRQIECFVAETAHEREKNGIGHLPSQKPPNGKSVVIVGAGPTGLTAAYTLLRRGYSCTVADRHASPGGSLRSHVRGEQLPVDAIESEVSLLERLGAHFRLGAVLGHDITLDGLLLGFDAVLLAVGEVSKIEGEALGLEMSPGGIRVDAETFQTRRTNVFAAGRAVRPITQLVRAMSDGLAAAESIDLFLSGAQARRKQKPFSSIMGRLSKSELEVFARGVSQIPASAACDACKGFSGSEAVTEASRCLHCECQSSGDCALQYYAQLYGANASRFPHERRQFVRLEQPGGIIFEPGKCILCGICIKLTELGRERLGLTFVGRGFDVRVAAPFNHSIEEGLGKLAGECVEHCPTGALSFRVRESA